MKQFKTILCALDLSEMSAKVADYAVTLAGPFDAQIIVVYAAPSINQYANFEVQPKALESFVDEVAVGAEQQMKRVMDGYFREAKAVSRVLKGYPAEEILAEAQRSNADIIVMGTHGRKGVDRLLFGSVAEKVVKGANIPVLTVSPDR